MFVKDSPPVPMLSAVAAAAVVLVPVLWTALGRVLRHHLTTKSTILNDIPNLGERSKRQKKIPGTAIVCGGRLASSLSKS